jgi:hypothetical protein
MLVVITVVLVALAVLNAVCTAGTRRSSAEVLQAETA